MARGLWVGLRTRCPWVGRSRLYRTAGANVRTMNTRPHSARSVPMSDESWASVLERAGVGTMHRTHALPRWTWCQLCQRVMPAARWEWWQATGRPAGRWHASNSSGGNAFLRF